MLILHIHGEFRIRGRALSIERRCHSRLACTLPKVTEALHSDCFGLPVAHLAPFVPRIPSDSAMASVKSMIAASLLAAPCADAFVAPEASQSSHAVTSLRGSTAVKAESSFSTYSALAATGAAVLSFVGAKKPAFRKTVACRFSPEAQIGVTEPLGFFDPAGFCKDEASFKDLRAKELKHGRIWVQDGQAFRVFGLGNFGLSS